MLLIRSTCSGSPLAGPSSEASLASKRYVVPYLPKGSTFGGAEIEAVARVLRSEGKLACGPERDAVEEEFAAYTGARHALSLTNCTVALEFATYLLNLQPGDEV